MSPSHNRRPRVAALVATLAVTTLISGCSADPSGQDDSSPQAGGTAIVALDFSVTCLDPQQTTGFAALLPVQHAVDQLTYQNPDTGKIEPWLATDWTIDEHSTTFTFTIRDGVTFSDGSNLTADVVARNIEEIIALGALSPLGTSYFAGFDRAEVDGDQVVISFTEPNAQFLQATSTTTLGILSASSFDATPEQRCAGEYSGSGPFTLTSFTPDSEVVIERRSDYDWAPTSAAHTGAALLERVEFPIVPEAGVRTGLLGSGQADAVMGVFREDEAGFDGNGHWLLARANPGFTNSLIVNGHSAILTDPQVREALQIAIDRQEVVDTVLSSTASPATGLLTSTSPFATDFHDLLALDVDRSRQLLDDAGWTIGDDGIRTKNGTRLSLRVAHFPVQSELIALLNQQLHTVGAELVSQIIDAGAWEKIIAGEGDHDLLQRNLTRADPDVLRNQLGSAYSNFLYLDQPGELDRLLEAQAAATDDQQRQDLVDQVQTLVLGENLVWPISEQNQVYAGNTDLQGVTLDSASRLNLYGAWLED